MPDRVSGRRVSARWATGIVVAFVVVGVVGGLLWRSRLDIPGGVVVGHRWYPDPWDPGQRAAFAATGWYVVIAGAAGLLLGILASLLSRAAELVTLAAVVVGSVLAVLLMLVVGLHGAPPDPQVAAAHLADGTRLRGTITVPRLGALLVLPLTAAVAIAVVFLTLAPHPREVSPIGSNEG